MKISNLLDLLLTFYYIITFMFDHRLETLAKILVNRSLVVKPADQVCLKLAGMEGLPLARACYQELILAGAQPTFLATDEEMEEFFYAHANSDQLQHPPTLPLHQANFFDKNLIIVAPSNVNHLAQTDTEKILTRSRLHQPVKDIILSKPWVLTYYPTPALAQAAKMSLRQLEDYVFAATNQDWSLLSQEMTTLASQLQDQPLHIVGKQTDLHLSTVGRTWIIDDWRSNMPGGEVFTSPVINSVNGYIYFDFPLTRDGKTISDIYLEFEKGEVVKATASTHQDFLRQLLTTDSGAKLVGEIALGLNAGCHRYLDNVLFDEKMAGTIHLALGAGFPECGQPCNRSALHLDIIKNMQLSGSQFWAGSKLITSHCSPSCN